MTDGLVSTSWKLKFAFRVATVPGTGDRSNGMDAHVYECEHPVHISSE